MFINEEILPINVDVNAFFNSDVNSFESFLKYVWFVENIFPLLLPKNISYPCRYSNTAGAYCEDDNQHQEEAKIPCCKKIVLFSLGFGTRWIFKI